MVSIEIICVGRLKEKYWVDAAAEYSKRLSRYCKFSVTELAEGADMISHLPSGSSGYVIALDIQGKKMNSEQLAAKLAEVQLLGKSRIAFLIGGSTGLTEEEKRAADLRLSFSDMTFPHQMFRIMLLEQVYRAFKINSNETYHK